MKKYICPNCGFKRRFATKKDGRKRYCKGCETQVYTSKSVLRAVLMSAVVNPPKFTWKISNQISQENLEELHRNIRKI
ncbi:MAG: hypothetical protein ACI4ES_12235 [Roseburia sp.]